jgi:hypothetical protein
MQGSRVRRPSSWLMLSLLALLLPAAWGCDRLGGSSGAGAAAPAGSSAEAEKTKKMEEKKAEIDRKAEEIRNMQGTDQEKLDAMNSLDQERRALNDQADKP